MKIAIIIPAAGLTKMAIGCLEACRQLAGDDYAIIFLPDAEVELPPALAEDDRLRVCPTGNVTIAAKRNHGMKMAAGAEAYAFIDADAYPPPDWLVTAAEILQARPEAGAVGGPNLSPPDQSWRQRAVGQALQSWLVTGARTYRKRLAPPRDCADLPTVNLIVRKTAASAVGGFAEQLETGEDIVFCARMIAAGWHIVYDPRVVVWHRDRRLFVPFIVQRVVYGLSAFRVMRAAPGMRQLFLFLPLLFLLVLSVLPVLAARWRLCCWCWILLVVAYGVTVLGEAVRHARRRREIPATAAAILIGNLFPAFGTLMALAGMPVNIRKLYQLN